MISFIGITFHLRVVLVTLRLVCVYYVISFFRGLRFTKILWRIINIKKLRKITGRRCGWGQGQVGAVWVQGTLHRHWSSTCFTNLKIIISRLLKFYQLSCPSFTNNSNIFKKSFVWHHWRALQFYLKKKKTSRVLFGEWLSLNGSTELGSA